MGKFCFMCSVNIENINISTYSTNLYFILLLLLKNDSIRVYKKYHIVSAQKL